MPSAPSKTGELELGDLAAHLPEFAGRLRQRHGFLIGAGEVQDALRAMQAVNVLDREQLKDALRAVLIASPEQGRTFDAEFELYFGRQALPPPQLPPLLPQIGADLQPETAPAQQGKKTGELQAQHSEHPTEMGELGDLAQLPQGQTGEADEQESRQTLLSRLSPNAGEGGSLSAAGSDLPELLRAASGLIRAVRLGHSRRKVPRPYGPKLDIRRTLHAARRTAGDPAELHWLGRPVRSPRFLIVLDGSRSMGQDSTRLLRFAFALYLRSKRVEVYAFSTGLTRLTPLLRASHPETPLTLPAEANAQGQAWGGGTRIGESLLRLARDERAHVTRDTAVFILSDGLDTGDPALVSRAMQDLGRRAGLLVWLSPLAGHAQYRPIQRAVKAALPYLDALLPAATNADLLNLPRALREGRGGRSYER